MAAFNITAPDGRKYRVTGENAEGAVAAVKKMFGGMGAHFETAFDPSHDVTGLPAARVRDVARRQTEAPRAMSAPQELVAGHEQDLAAAAQGTSPIVRDYRGNLNYEPLGELVEADFGQAYRDRNGKMLAVNPQHDIVLRDPETGRMMVFARSQNMEEGRLASFGRVTLPGMTSVAPAGARIATAASSAARAPSRSREIVASFDRAGVDPSLPAISQNRGVSTLANVVGDTVAGGPVRAGFERQVGQAAQQAERVSGGLSDVRSPSVAGERLQSGVQRFVSEEVPAAQGQMYGRAREVMEFMDGNAVSHLFNTRTQINRLSSMIRSGSVREFVTDKNFAHLAELLKGVGPKGLSFNDLRELRTQVRLLRPAEGTRVGVNRAAIDRIYDALTKDMHALAKEVGGDYALNAIKRADQYTRAFEVVRKPALQKIIGAPSGEKVFTDVLRLAQEGAGADWRKLVQIRRSVSPQEWDDFAATVIDEMGKGTAGNATAAGREFTPTAFVTNFAKLSPRGKAVLFGGERSELRKALDDLATVSGELKRVSRMGNPSGSGRYVTGAAAGTGLFFDPVTALTALAGGRVAAHIMSSPKTVRWLTALGRARRAGSPPKAEGELAKRIPGLVGQGEESVAGVLRDLIAHVPAMTSAGGGAEGPLKRRILEVPRQP